MTIFGLPRWAIELIGGALILLAAWAALHFYGQHRYDEGVSNERAAWQQAAEKLKADAAKSATKADDAAAKRTTDFIQKQATDQAAVRQAEAEGKSPLDAIFGN